MWQVVHKHVKTSQFFVDQWLDQFPLSTGQTATNVRHVDGRIDFTSARGNIGKTFPQCIISDRGHAALPPDSFLGDHAGNPDLRVDFHNSNGS